MNSCSERQQTIARGELLNPADQRHVSACVECADVAMWYSLLERSLDALSGDIPVGFADRVMARIESEHGSTVRSWFERPWIQLALAHAGLFCAAINVARFVARVFLPSVASGALR